MEWNVILSYPEGGYIRTVNNPTSSGRYLCTCILHADGVKDIKYLQMMEYDAEKDYWHDVGRESAISHTVLAWAKVDVCDFEDYVYHAGGWLSKKD